MHTTDFEALDVEVFVKAEKAHGRVLDKQLSFSGETYFVVEFKNKIGLFLAHELRYISSNISSI